MLAQFLYNWPKNTTTDDILVSPSVYLGDDIVYHLGLNHVCILNEFRFNLTFLNFEVTIFQIIL